MAHWRVIGSSSTGVPFDFVIAYWRYIIVDCQMSALCATEFADTTCADHVPIGSYASADWATKIPSGSTFAKKALWVVRVRERATTIT